MLYALAGGVAGYAVVKLREAERQISTVQAREEVARTLHDGVLQTLAVVQRRASDPDLSRLAREQERELREFLFGAEPAGGELGPRLRAAAARFEDRFGGRANVIVADDLLDSVAAGRHRSRGRRRRGPDQRRQARRGRPRHGVRRARTRTAACSAR